ncbi:MAG: GNAT family N-acetyltransferase [Chloroflexota bacterium]
MSDPVIELREVTKADWKICIQLELEVHQKGFVSSNLFSIAQSKFEPCRKPCAIYNHQNEMVGFIMYNDCPLDDGTYRISRLMIDKKFQGNGYGRLAAQEAINRLKHIPDCFEILLDFAPENSAAERLWTSLGFVVFDKLSNTLVARLIVK